MLAKDALLRSYKRPFGMQVSMFCKVIVQVVDYKMITEEREMPVFSHYLRYILC